MALNTSGLSSGTNWNWTELPDDLEKRLAASQYLVEIGLHKENSEDLAYCLTVALAEARKANKDLYDSMSTEVRRYRERWNRERLIANDLADEVAELAANGEELESELADLEDERDHLIDACITAQEKFDNAVAWCDDVSLHINWNFLTTGDTK